MIGVWYLCPVKGKPSNYFVHPSWSMKALQAAQQKVKDQEVQLKVQRKLFAENAIRSFSSTKELCISLHEAINHPKINGAVRA